MCFRAAASITEWAFLQVKSSNQNNFLIFNIQRQSCSVISSHIFFLDVLQVLIPHFLCSSCNGGIVECFTFITGIFFRLLKLWVKFFSEHSCINVVIFNLMSIFRAPVSIFLNIFCASCSHLILQGDTHMSLFAYLVRLNYFEQFHMLNDEFLLISCIVVIVMGTSCVNL